MNAPNLNDTIPSWMHEIFLGYGNPRSAHYRHIRTESLSTKLNEYNEDGNYLDTFLDTDHVVESFPDADVLIGDDVSSAPYRLQITRDSSGSVGASADHDTGKDKIVVTASEESSSVMNYHVVPNTQLDANAVRFTPSQVRPKLMIEL